MSQGRHKFKAGDAAYVVYEVSPVPTSNDNRAHAELHLVVITRANGLDLTRSKNANVYTVVAAKKQMGGKAVMIEDAKPFQVYEYNLIDLGIEAGDYGLEMEQRRFVLDSHDIKKSLPKYQRDSFRRITYGLHKKGGKNL